MSELLLPKIASEIQQLDPSALITLFELDVSGIPGQELEPPFRFHAGRNGLMGVVVWNGQSFSPLPIEAEGFEMTSQGTLPHPVIRVANVSGLISAALKSMDDLVGCRVRRIRTFVKYMDAVNFSGGVNPQADPTAVFPIDTYYVNRKVAETRVMVEFELAPVIEVQGVKLPARQVIANVCAWKYKSPECGYDGSRGFWDKNDQPTTAQLDRCGQRLTSCKLRHPPGSSPAGGGVVSGASPGEAPITAGVSGIPFGGFPGAGLVRS